MTTPAEASDLVEQETTTTGTGDLSLASIDGPRDFSDEWSTGGTNKFYYHVKNDDVSTTEYEVGKAHLSDSSTLVRDTVLSSSNSDNKVSFSSGTKSVVSDYPSDQQAKHQQPGDEDATADITDDQSNTIFDYSNQYVPDSVLQTTPEPNVPAWTEDGNSPITVSGIGTHTYNFSDTFDKYKVVFELKNIVDDGSANSEVHLQVNGVTSSDYNETRMSGGGFTSQDHWSLGHIFDDVSGEDIDMFGKFEIDGRFQDLININAELAGEASNGNWKGIDGGNIRSNSSSSPVSQFTIFTNSAVLFDFNARVYGYDY